MSIHQPNDQYLINQYLQGNESALELLVENHKKRVFSYIMMLVKDKQLAEDVFQDTFIKVINTLKKGNYNDEGKFLPWVMRIAHNLVIDHFRRNKRMPMVRGGNNEEGDEFDIFSVIPSDDYSAEQNIEKVQIGKSLKKLVDYLPQEQKEVLIMRHYFDMSFKEISEQTNVSINTALGRMRYALINMRKMMEERKMNLVS